jgi:TonB family protein
MATGRDFNAPDSPGAIPRGIEVLIKKAAVDPAFKKLLLEKRAGAADAIGLKLTAAEQAMLAAVPLSQLEGIVAHTRVAAKSRPAFLGYAAGAMLAALGAAVIVSHKKTPPPDVSTRDEDITRDMPVEKTIRLLEMPSTGIRPAIHDEKGYVVYVSGDGVNDKKRRMGYLQNKLKPVLAFARSEYYDYVAGDPDANEGNITVRFTVIAAGYVKNARIISDGTGSALLGYRILERISAWKIDPIDEGDVEVVYKFNFVPRRRYPSTGVVLAEAYPAVINIPEIIRASGSEGIPLLRMLERHGRNSAGITGIRPDDLSKRKNPSGRLQSPVKVSKPGATENGAE